jgi:hypothetical protein
MDDFRLFLHGGPADEVRERRPEWRLFDAGLGVPESIPDHVWLCRVEWGVFEWRPRLWPEMIRGRSALYWLERERDESPKRSVSGAFVYAHVPDGEVGEFVSEEEARAGLGFLEAARRDRAATDSSSG